MLCDLPTFCTMIRQRAERLPPPPRSLVRYPYAAIDELIAETHTREAHVLTELVTAIERGSGTFSEADILALDSRALRVADAVIECSVTGYARR
ncbi:MAG: hypothetical protein K2X67_06915 [Burkholderiales bacterium]|nr:hypothetical protein [Burkholderiales bacterium]